MVHNIKALKQVINKAKKLKGHILQSELQIKETTILWNKKTGKPIYNAIVCQDRRTKITVNYLRKKIMKIYLEIKLDYL